MGWASFGAWLVVKGARAIKGGYKWSRSSSLGVTKPHMWDVKARGQYQGIKALHKLGHNEHLPAKYDMVAAIRDLPNKHDISAWWLRKAIKATRSKGNLKTIMSYIKNKDATGNLTPHDKAELWAMCLSKLRHLEMMKDFM